MTTNQQAVFRTAALKQKDWNDDHTHNRNPP